MFKNKGMQIKFVNTDHGEGLDLSEVIPKIELPSKETVQEVSHEVIKKSAIAVMAIIVTATVARAASDIIVHHATK